jgi:hypothetical protein
MEHSLAFLNLSTLGVEVKGGKIRFLRRQMAVIYSLSGFTGANVLPHQLNLRVSQMEYRLAKFIFRN